MKKEDKVELERLKRKIIHKTAVVFVNKVELNLYDKQLLGDKDNHDNLIEELEEILDFEAIRKKEKKLEEQCRPLPDIG